MKKMTLKMRLLGGLVIVSMLFAASCAQGVDDETYQSSVKNQQMVSPELTDANFSTVTNVDGSESVKVSWPLIKGCGGCQCNVWIVDDPENPQEIVNEIVDGSSFLFPKIEDTKYKVSVLALGNKANNNTDAEIASEFAYSTLVPALTIPAGTELSAFIAQHLDMEATGEQAFELEAGATYPVRGIIDFKDKLVTFRGNKIDRPIVTLEGRTENPDEPDFVSGIMTAGGLKVKFINFDCSKMGFRKFKKDIDQASSNYNYAFLTMGDGIYPTLKSQNFGSGVDKGYVLPDPIIFEQCNVKNLPKAFFGCGYNAWLVQDFRIVDCIIQIQHVNLDHDNGGNFISFIGTCKAYDGAVDKGSLSGVQNITIRNSTIYNINTMTKKTRFARFGSANSIVDVFGSHTGGFTILNSTLYNVFHVGEFGNNIPAKPEYIVTYGSTIFQDCARIQKLGSVGDNGRATLKTSGQSTVWVERLNTAENEMLSSNDTKKVKLIEENPNFAQPTELDLEDDKFGGQNFKPTGQVSSTIGDPRWLE